MNTPLKDRISGGLAAAVVVGIIGVALTLGLAFGNMEPHPSKGMLVNLLVVRPPHQPQPAPKIRQRRAANRPASRNITNRATNVVKPVPLIVPPTLPSLMAASVAGTGMASSSGQSDTVGPGSGAGGSGNGSGGGGKGDGNETPPRLRKGRLKFSDLPPALRAASAQGRVEVRYDVEIDGHVRECLITASSGNEALDTATCRLIQLRFLYAPSLDGDGRPIRSTIEESHSWIIDRDDDPPRP